MINDFVASRAGPRLELMPRKPAPIKTINLEAGMPQVEAARLRMQHELELARKQGYAAVKLIHGYGSSGVGGTLRVELQKELARQADAGRIQAFIAGENWRVSDEAAWPLLRRYPEWKQDQDLGKSNQGITIVVL
jgi:DNA-nicking Smr family endonuclease